VHFFILDLTHGHRIETAAARVFLHCVREFKLKDSILVVCGVCVNSGLHADFMRADVPLVFDVPDTVSLTGSAIAAFETRDRKASGDLTALGQLPHSDH
jgi:hypothetical protein